MENYMMAIITVSLLLTFFIVLLISIPGEKTKGDRKAAESQ